MRRSRLRDRFQDRLRDRFQDDDRGMVTAFVAITSLTLLFVAGMVFDAGRILASKRETLNVAESAARAGAQELDEAAIRSGADVILADQATVNAAVCRFINNMGNDDYSCGNASVTTNGNQVTVQLTSSVDPAVLGAIGVGTQTFELTGVACVARGIEDADC